VRVPLLCIALVIGACHGDSGTSQPKSDVHFHIPARANKGPTVAELTKGMVDAASLGKSDLAVELKFDVRQRPAVGQTVEIDLALVPQIDASPANIDMTGGDSLALAPGASSIVLPAVEAGRVYRESVKVTPSTDGVLVLSLNVSLIHDDITESRLFSIPLIVER